MSIACEGQASGPAHGLRAEAELYPLWRRSGKNGETIKALQTYSGALIQIDQTVEPTKVTISGTPHSLSLAVSMVTDIVKGTFKGFALLRQIANPGNPRAGGIPNPMAQPRPVYAPGYGLIPPSQVRSQPCVLVN